MAAIQVKAPETKEETPSSPVSPGSSGNVQSLAAFREIYIGNITREAALYPKVPNITVRLDGLSHVLQLPASKVSISYSFFMLMISLEI